MYFMKNCFLVVEGKKLFKILNTTVENKKVERQQFFIKKCFQVVKSNPAVNSKKVDENS